VELDPGFAQAWALIAADNAAAHFAEIDASAEIMEKAKAAIETAVRLAPEDPTVIEMQGDYYYYGYRDYAKAAAQYRRLQSLRPNSSEAYGSLGLIYRRQGHGADAIANFRRALELDPHNARYGQSLGAQLEAQHRYPECQLEFDRGAAFAPSDLFARGFAVTVPFFARGSKAETEAFEADLRSNRPDDPFALGVRRICARILGDFNEAIRITAKQKYFDGDSLPHWQQDLDEAFDHIGGGDMAAGRSLLEKLLPELQSKLEKEPTNSALWLAVGLAEAVLGNSEQALIAADKGAGLVPESLDSVDGPVRSATRAKVLAWAGKKDEALSELTRLMRTPYGTNVYAEPTDPGWIPLRGDPRFEAILSDPKNNEPLN